MTTTIRRRVALLAALVGLICGVAAAPAGAAAKRHAPPVATKAARPALQATPPPDPVFPASAIHLGIRGWARDIQTNYGKGCLSFDEGPPWWHVVSTTLDDTHYGSLWHYQGDYNHIGIDLVEWASTCYGSWLWQHTFTYGENLCYRSDAVTYNRLWLRTGPNSWNDAWIKVPGYTGGWVCRMDMVGDTGSAYTPKVVSS